MGALEATGRSRGDRGSGAWRHPSFYEEGCELCQEGNCSAVLITVYVQEASSPYDLRFSITWHSEFVNFSCATILLLFPMIVEVLTSELSSPAGVAPAIENEIFIDGHGRSCRLRRGRQRNAWVCLSQ